MYVVLALAMFGGVSLFGMVSSYLRMTWKVSNYNSLRDEVDTLRNRYAALQREANDKQSQLASLQTMATEVTVSLGLTRKLAGADDISDEGPLVPSYKESLEDYNFLRSASFSRLHHGYVRQSQKNVIPTLWPVTGRLLSNFGERSDPFSGEGAFHTGVDISAGTGTTVKAAADGVVYFAEYSGRYGKLIEVEHGNGVRTRYAHLSHIGVVTGQEVRRGDIIGLSGATGRVTSPHLHFEVRLGSIPVNPYPYLAKSALGVTTTRDLPF